MGLPDENVQIVGIGAPEAPAVVDPEADGTTIALLKGILTQQLALKADLATVKADLALVKAAAGAVDDVAVSTPATDGSMVALLKGLVTLNQPAG
jgi:hypothetical protein